MKISGKKERKKERKKTQMEKGEKRNLPFLGKHTTRASESCEPIIFEVLSMQVRESPSTTMS
jgi:hypothetical protein